MIDFITNALNVVDTPFNTNGLITATMAGSVPYAGPLRVAKTEAWTMLGRGRLPWSDCRPSRTRC